MDYQADRTTAHAARRCFGFRSGFHRICSAAHDDTRSRRCVERLARSFEERCRLPAKPIAVAQARPEGIPIRHGPNGPGPRPPDTWSARIPSARLRGPAQSHPAPQEGCPAPAPSRPVRRPAWCPAAPAPAVGFHAPDLAHRLTGTRLHTNGGRGLRKNPHSSFAAGSCG